MEVNRRMGKDSVKWISHYVLFTRIANLAVISLEPLIDGEYYSFTRDTFLKKKEEKKNHSDFSRF